MNRYLLLIFLAFPLLLEAQVNTERYRKDYDRYGMMYTNSFGLNFATGNSHYVEFNNQFRVDYNDTIQDYFAVMDYSYRMSNKKKTGNKGFIHLRTVRDLEERKFLMLEGFTQFQFDEFLLLRYRMLIGGGFRFDPVALADSSLKQNGKIKVFLGSGVFYEHEDYNTSPAVNTRLIRWSNYLSLVWAISDKVDINMINYFQPAPQDFSNYRYSLHMAMSTKLSGKLYYEMRMEYQYRSIPYGGKKPGDLDMKNTLRFSF